MKFSLFFSLSVELQKKNDQTAKDLSKTPFHSALARLIQQLTTTPSASLCDPALNPYSVEQQPREQAIETNNTSTYNVSSPKSAAITASRKISPFTSPSIVAIRVSRTFNFFCPVMTSLSLSLSLSRRCWPRHSDIVAVIKVPISRPFIFVVGGGRVWREREKERESEKKGEKE